MKDYLKLNNISLSYHTKEGETLALDDLSFSANKHEYLSIVGPSGAGKTTLLQIMGKQLFFH